MHDDHFDMGESWLRPKNASSTRSARAQVRARSASLVHTYWLRAAAVLWIALSMIFLWQQLA